MRPLFLPDCAPLPGDRLDGALFIIVDDDRSTDDPSAISPVVEEKDPIWSSDANDIISSLSNRAASLNEE